MEVFLNEKCLADCKDIDVTLSFLAEHLSILDKAKIKTYTSFNDFNLWLKEWDSCLDATAKSYSLELFNLLEESPDNSNQFYYYYFNHEEFGLLISENISTSSISNAADKVLSNHLTAILNLPGSTYSYRTHLPILKSPHNSKLKDELANIPCFHDAKGLTQFVFLEKKIKPLIDACDFDTFCIEYLTHSKQFDFVTWKPKQLDTSNTLIPKFAFPITTCDYIKKKLARLLIKRGSTEDNISQYKQFGNIVLALNGYCENKELSSHYSRFIYEAGFGNNKLLISLDIENGGLEVIESDGTHLGVYGYDGHFIKKYKNLKELEIHSLKNIPKHMFIFKE